MIALVCKRLLALIPVLLLVLVLIFLLARQIPGDPAIALLGPGATDEQIARLHEQLQLDAPLAMQFLHYLAGVLQGDLGLSLKSGQPVLQEILLRLPATLELALFATLLAVLVGVPLGLLAALRPHTWLDQTLRLVSLAGISMPAFVLALLLQLLLSIGLGWLPISGRSSPYLVNDPITGLALLDALLMLDGSALLDALAHLLMPALVLASFLGATLARFVRNSLVETLDDDYIRTARAKGLAEYQVVLQHGLRNALLPTLTVIGLNFAEMLGGAILTETVFSWPGIGRFMFDAIRNRDYPVIQGATLVFALLFVLVSLLVDILYAVADPRVRRRSGA